MISKKYNANTSANTLVPYAFPSTFSLNDNQETILAANNGSPIFFCMIYPSSLSFSSKISAKWLINILNINIKICYSYVF